MADRPVSDIVLGEYRPQGSVLDVWRSRDLEVLNDGPAGTGKTRGNCERTNILAQKYPGSRHLWLMKHRSDMTETVLATFENDVLPPSSPLLKGPSRVQRTKYTYSHGSEIIIRGLDDPQATRSLEVDQITIFEGSRLVLDQYQILLRALRGRSMPYKQIVVDTNPSTPDHWLLERVENGSMRRINSTHKDNPRYWDADKKQWTPEGVWYRDVVLGALTGPDRQRLLDGIWAAEAGAIFDASTLITHRDTYGQSPWHTGELVPMNQGKRLDQMIQRGDRNAVALRPWKQIGVPAPWSFWCDIDRSGKPIVDGEIVIGADVSWGQGASNSVLSVWQRNDRRKIAEFAYARIPPEAFARLMAAAGFWFGGSRGFAYLVFEVNGPGEGLPVILRDRLEYPWIYRQETTATGTHKRGEALGWRSNQARKAEAATELRRCYADEDIINPSIRSIDEALGWVKYKTEGIGPARLESESIDARATHGDRVVADMLGVKGMNNAPLSKIEIPRMTNPASWNAEDDDKNGFVWS